MVTGPAQHWDHVYDTVPPDRVSWFQATPETSLRLVREALSSQGSVVDVGAGTSTLVDGLLASGFTDLTVVDVSARALAVVQKRVDDRSGRLTLVHADLLDWQPERTFDVWHDRAVFHFLTSAQARARYVAMAEESVTPGGAVILGTFAPDGPTRCSGLDVNSYDAGGLAAQLGPTFVLAHHEREEHITPSGAVQPFTWVVLRRR